MITKFERDMLQEFLNIGFGAARASLERSLSAHIYSVIPEILLDVPASSQVLFEETGNHHFVLQSFSGTHNGKCMLLVKDDASRIFARRACETFGLGELEESMVPEIIGELGNNAINAVMAFMLNQLEGSVFFKPQKIHVGSISQTIHPGGTTVLYQS